MSELAAEWETREQVLAAARAARYPVSGSQLGRLYRAGLISQPRVRSLGRGRGTASLYPPGTSTRLVRIAQIQASERRLTYVAWRLWWEDGGEIPQPARDLLLQLGELWDRERDRLASLLTAEAADDPTAAVEMEQLYQEAEQDRITGALGQARRNTGRFGFSTVMRVLVEVATGRFTGYDDGEVSDPDAGALVEKALGLDRARIDRLAGAGPWYSGDSEIDLAGLSRTLRARSLRDAASADTLELDEARAELRGLVALISAIAPVLERLLGRTAFGFNVISRALSAPTPRTQALMLLGWLVLREDRELREGLRRLAAMGPSAEATAKLYAVTAELRREVPPFESVLTDDRLAEAQRDGAAARQLHDDIARVCEENLGEVEAFFRSHPEMDGLIARIEAKGNSQRPA